MLRNRGWLSSLTSVFVEPAESVAPPVTELGPRTSELVVAVVGLRREAGATTFARALAAELALRDEGRSALVTAASVAAGGIPLGTPAATRLTRAAARAGLAGTRAVGRLALVETENPFEATAALSRLAPLVLDLPQGADDVGVLAPHAAALVASPDCQPALAALVAESIGPATPTVTVLNRADVAGSEWEGRYDCALPESRIAAQLAFAGREAPNAFGRAVADVADRLVALVA